MEDERHEYFREAIENNKDKEALELLLGTIEAIAFIGVDNISGKFVVEECGRYVAAYSKGSHTRDCRKDKEEQ